jgi:SAM-dependent methyltransferase
MSKSEKELAFLRDLSITKDWTERFTNFADKHFEIPDKGNFLYFNAGTLSHALELREKLDKDVALTAIFEDKELQTISEAKAAAIKAKVNFSVLKDLESESFDAVLADLTFVRPDKLGEILDEIVYLTKKGGRISFFLPTAGSFGEIFSYLWETFLDVDLVEKGGEIERLISEISTVSQAEDLATEAGLKKVLSETNKEVFEYDSGNDFISSTLVADFLVPGWLDFLSEKERQKTLGKLAQIIDAEQDGMTFRFSVKATFVEGMKS